MEKKETTLEKFHQLMDEMNRNREGIFGIYLGGADSDGYDVNFAGSTSQLELAFTNILATFCSNDSNEACTYVSIAMLNAVANVVMSESMDSSQIKEFLIRALSGTLMLSDEDVEEEETENLHCDA